MYVRMYACMKNNKRVEMSRGQQSREEERKVRKIRGLKSREQERKEREAQSRMKKRGGREMEEV